LQEQCHDGVRKKAKYLHDAPAEALIPPGMSGYHHPYMNGTKASSVSSASGVPMTESPTAHSQSHYTSTQSPNLDLYSQSSQAQMPPPMQAHASFGNQQAPQSPPYHSARTQQPHNMASSMPQSSQSLQQFSGGPLFDPSDPALFNFDIASLNFGNQYGALEFGMLNHMSSNNDGNGGDMLNQMNQVPAYNPNFTESPALMFGQDALVNADWQGNHHRANSTSGLLQTPHNTPIATSIDRQDGNGFTNAYTIAAGPGSLASASPATSVAGQEVGENGPNSPAMFAPPASQSSASPYSTRHVASKAQPVQPPQPSEQYQPPAQNARKRPFDTDTIYDSVNKPYQYTAGFHRLFNFISRRFSSEKRLRIAKAVAAVRPSLLTYSGGLTNKDLLFMEVSIQRKLYEYTEFINAYGTPTIITRRDGAIVAASKEFSILTRWSKSVLLGKEPNLNVNTGGASGASTGPGSASRTRLSSAEEDVRSTVPSNPATTSASPQPVLLAEILDQDSVVNFYEEYARLAFGDPRGFGQHALRLLKYRTKEEVAAATAAENEANAEKKRRRSGSLKAERAVKTEEGEISGEAGINRLGEKEGKVDVMCCWNVRRDVFEVPMLIVMNVSIFLHPGNLSPLT
jgi:hypothetical protein